MRALLVNPKSPVSFWTFPETCNESNGIALVAPLSLVTVAALLPREWELRLVDLGVRRLTGADWDWADMVMISGMIVQKESQIAVIKESKQRGKIVVVGGPFATSVPHEALAAGADYVIRGEGECNIPTFLAAMREGKTRGVFEDQRKTDMTESPTPRFDLLDLKDYEGVAIQTSRGCPYDCEFCDVVNLYGRTPRYKSPDQVMDELTAIYRLGWRGPLFICDDNFIGNGKRAREILSRLIPWMKDRGEPFSFWTQASLDLGNDLEMIDLMTEANFSFVFIGVESPDEAILQLNRKHQNIRNPLLESLDNINKNGLSVLASFVIGFDGEKKGAGDQICQFVETAGVPFVALNVVQALPNTRLWKRLEREGRLLEERTSGQTIGARLNFVPTRPESEIMAEFADAWNYLYEPSRYLARAYRYCLSMRPTRRALAIARGENLPEKKPEPKQSQSFRWRDVLRLLALVWRRGIRPPLAFQFWKQMIGIYRQNPSRMVRYLNLCHLGENFFAHLNEINKRGA